MSTGFIALLHLPLVSGVQPSTDPTHPALQTSSFSSWKTSPGPRKMSQQLEILQTSPFQVHLWRWFEIFWVDPFEMYLRTKRAQMKSQLLYAPCKPPPYPIFKSLVFLSLPLSLRKRMKTHLSHYLLRFTKHISKTNVRHLLWAWFSGPRCVA